MAARERNPTVQLLPGNRAVAVQPDGSSVKIPNSCNYIQLFWALQGCRGGLQHYRCCTAHTLSKALSLNCFFCNPDEAECKAEKRLMPTESELWVMRKLLAAQLSTEWCWQVQFIDCWGAACDFMHISKKAVLQVDGSSHFKDMFGKTCRAQLETDLSFCVKAVQRGVSVIRVHELQQRMWLSEGFLQNATAVATSGVCIVLSVGYCGVHMLEGGQLVSYADRLAQLLGGWTVTKLPWCVQLLP